MRIEYMIVGFILLLVVFGILIGLLTGVIPSFEKILALLRGL